MEGKKKKKNPGKDFEQDIRASFPSDCFVERYKDDTAGFHGVHNPADFRVYKYPYTYLIECKSHKGKSLPFAKIGEKQLEAMLRAVNYPGIYGIYLINFRELEETYWIAAVYIDQYIKSGERKSIPVDFCKRYGMRIPQRKKRVRYAYNLENFLRGKGR